MIKLKYKIAIPFMAVIIVIPLITMIFFNIIMHSYILKTSREDLKDAIETTNFIVKQQLIENRLSKQNQDSLALALPKLKTVLKTSKIATRTEILVFSKQGRLIYPRGFSEDTFLYDALIEAAGNANFGNTDTLQINVDNKTYLVAGNNSKQLQYKLIYVLSMENASNLIRMVNLVLFSILAAATFLGVIISILISNSISGPIRRLSETAHKIGKGEFQAVEAASTSKEFYELSSSMNTMSQNLQLYENSQKTFLQNASHELRTPLMSIQGYSEGIAKGIFADNKQAAEIICSESRRLTNLVEQLLVLSKIENNTYKINLCKINLNDIMKDYIQRINGLALKGEKQLVLSADNQHIPVWVDDELLAQVVVNIASNCIRYAKTKVEIEVYKDSNNAFIKIGDDGPGIAQEALPHIFDRFYKGREGNFGLGLSIAKSSVIAMKGSISASNSQAGAEFLIALPLAY